MFFSFVITTREEKAKANIRQDKVHKMKKKNSKERRAHRLLDCNVATIVVSPTCVCAVLAVSSFTVIVLILKQLS